MSKRSCLFLALRVMLALAFVPLTVFSNAFSEGPPPATGFSEEPAPATPNYFRLIDCGFLYARSIPGKEDVQMIERPITVNGSTYDVYYFWAATNLVDLWGNENSYATRVSQSKGTIEWKKVTQDEEMPDGIDVPVEDYGCAYVARFSHASEYGVPDQLLLVPRGFDPATAFACPKLPRSHCPIDPCDPPDPCLATDASPSVIISMRPQYGTLVPVGSE